jgi:hypothetical protein
MDDFYAVMTSVLIIGISVACGTPIQQIAPVSLGLSIFLWLAFHFAGRTISVTFLGENGVQTILDDNSNSLADFQLMSHLGYMGLPKYRFAYCEFYTLDGEKVPYDDPSVGFEYKDEVLRGWGRHLANRLASHGLRELLRFNSIQVDNNYIELSSSTFTYHDSLNEWTGPLEALTCDGYDITMDFDNGTHKRIKVSAKYYMDGFAIAELAQKISKTRAPANKS